MKTRTLLVVSGKEILTTMGFTEQQIEEESYRLGRYYTNGDSDYCLIEIQRFIESAKLLDMKGEIYHRIGVLPQYNGKNLYVDFDF